MIRRFLAAGVLVVATLLVTATPASAASTDILCLYNKDTPRFGFCIAVPW